MKLYLALFITAFILAFTGLTTVSAHRGHHYEGNPCQYEAQEGLCGTPVASDSATPTIEVTPEVSIDPSPTAGQSGTPAGDGLSDNRSDGKSSCPECTKPPVRDVNGEVLSAQVGWK